jgi:hypothetical protein
MLPRVIGAGALTDTKEAINAVRETNALLRHIRKLA